MKWCVALLIVVTALAARANPPETLGLTNPLIADTSHHTIEIRTSFNGAQMLVFGARNSPGEIVMVVRGPTANVRLRRKEKIAGMWMHVEQHRYDAVPLFFARASTRPLETITDAATIESLQLTSDAVTLAAKSYQSPQFHAALGDILRGKRWWQEPFATIDYFGESLFKARLNMPDSLPGGDYTIELYLFHEGSLRATQIIPVTVYKVGLEASLVENATRHSVFYGVFAVAMALAGGWLAHRLFHRN